MRYDSERDKFESKKIIKLIDNLIGVTTAVGDPCLDEEIENNLKVLIDVTNWCLDGILSASDTAHDYRGSMRSIGQRALGALLDYKKWLDETLVELGVENE